MGEYKPVGSEKLKGDEKLQRILDLTYYKNKNNFNPQPKSYELVKESVMGGVIGIVKEKDGYYVKRGLNESSLNYIGGLFMKNKNRFKSYSEALKQLELIHTNESLTEGTKYVLKQNNTKTEQPIPQEPIADTPVPPSVDDQQPPVESQPTVTPDSGNDESKRSDYMSEVQKFAGKLAQELRDIKDQLESDDIKYVINMIISAVDLDKLDLEDMEEIGNKFNTDDDDLEEVPAVDGDVEDSPEDSVSDEEDELGENMKLLDDFINSKFDLDDEPSDDEIGLSDETPQHDAYDSDGLGDEEDIDEDVDEEVELDLDSIKAELNNSVNSILHKYFKK
jgi:hypothetical protein